jgi:hypothetical protein
MDGGVEGKIKQQNCGSWDGVGWEQVLAENHVPSVVDLHF